MSRLGRSQPVQPTVWHGFVDPGPGPVGTVPPRVQVVPLDADRHHLRAAPPAVIATHGPVGAPAVVSPPAPLAVPLNEKPRARPLDAIVLSGVLGFTVPPTASPPASFVVPLNERRFPVVPPSTSTHGFVDSGVGVPGTTPPEPVNVDRADQRDRYRALAPIAINGVLASLAAAPPAASPPGPFVVPLEERRRFLAALPPEFSVGFDNVDPPAPSVVEPQDDRRRRRPPLDAFVARPSAAFVPAAPALPPPPFVVPIDRHGRFLVVLPSTGQHGFVPGAIAPVDSPLPQLSSKQSGRLSSTEGGVMDDAETGRMGQKGAGGEVTTVVRGRMGSR